MAVYRRGYERYRGPLRGRWARFAVLPRYTWSRLLGNRPVVLLAALSMVWPLVSAAGLYVGNHIELLEGLGFGSESADFVRGDGRFFLVFMRVQAVFAVFMAALAGPGCIAPDVSNNALELYFSRPISRAEYAAGRFAALFGLLSVITWVPGVILVAVQAAMAGNGWAADHWRFAPALAAGLGLWILVVALVALASGAYVRMKVLAGGLVLGFFFILGGASGMINAVFRSQWGHLANPSWAARRLWHPLLGVDPPAGPGPAACAAVLAALVLLLALVLERRLRPVEVVR